jgi:hypothetical protein
MERNRPLRLKAEHDKVFINNFPQILNLNGASSPAVLNLTKKNDSALTY